jgi:hypothetical protein
MEQKPFEIIIHTTYEGCSITIVRRSNCGYLPSVAKPIMLDFEPLKSEGDPFEPTFKLNNIEAMWFLEAWKEALEPYGKKREKEIKMKARLAALEEELRDLRQIIGVLSNGELKRRISLE